MRRSKTLPPLLALALPLLLACPPKAKDAQSANDESQKKESKKKEQRSAPAFQGGGW